LVLFEFRRPVGFDRIISANSNLMNGVMVSLNKDISGQENYLLDMTPENRLLGRPGFSRESKLYRFGGRRNNYTASMTAAAL
jgi:hypothetical protein